MGVIYTPPARREPTRPYADAADHRLGTVWQTPDGLRWVVEWDDQDKRHRWELVECQGHATCTAALHEHGCYADLGRCDHPDEHGEQSAPKGEPLAALGEIAVTPEMVDAGAREAFFTDDAGGHIRGGHTWGTIPEVGRENYRTMVRAVLHAALRTGRGGR